MIPAPPRILLCTSPADFRNSIDGLSARVELHLKESPLSGTMFVFRNKTGNALKLLVWSHGGFVLVYKKLERGRFRVPVSEADRVTLTPAAICVAPTAPAARTVRAARWPAHPPNQVS